MNKDRSVFGITTGLLAIAVLLIAVTDQPDANYPDGCTMGFLLLWAAFRDVCLGANEPEPPKQ